MVGSSIEVGTDGVGRIFLGTGEVAVFDACDFELLAGHRWVRLFSTKGKPYIFANIGGRLRTGLGPIIMGTVSGQLVDHKNGDTLNNRRSNLRVVTFSQNNCNVARKTLSKSPYKGVKERRPGSWMAYGTENGRQKYLGLHPTAECAAVVYDNYARAAYGEFACVNFPETGERGALPEHQINLASKRPHSEANLTTRERNHA